MVSSTAIAIRGNLFLETKSFFPNFNIFTKHQHGTDMFSKFPRHVSLQKVRAPASNEQARILHYGFLYIIRQCIARTTHRNQLGSLVMEICPVLMHSLSEEKASSLGDFSRFSYEELRTSKNYNCASCGQREAFCSKWAAQRFTQNAHVEQKTTNCLIIVNHIAPTTRDLSNSVLFSKILCCFKCAFDAVFLNLVLQS